MHDLYAQFPYLYVKSIKNLITLLEKAKEFAKSQGISETELLEKRLAPDMLPLVRQIQIVSDIAKGQIARMSGNTPPSMEDKEATIDECIERLNKTVAYVKSIDPKEFEAADTRKAVVPYIPGKYQNMIDYTLDVAIPNFYFHYVTAYDILRHAGMQIGKTDYIGGLSLHDLA